jgi:glycosyltransferase involved in cell wall biosynthesis
VNRVHVLHVIDGLGLGGAERMLVDIANRTVADGHRVSVCVTRTTTTLARELDPRIRLLVLGRRTRVSPLALLRLARFVRGERVDVIHAHMRSTVAFVLQLRVSRAIRTPIVFHHHGFALHAGTTAGTVEIDTSVPTWFRIGQRFVGHYVGVYDKLTAWARRAGMDVARTSTIPNAIDFARFTGAPVADIRGELGLDAGAVVALLVATVRRDKGIEMLIDALARTAARDRVHVVIAGVEGEPAYAAACKARLAGLGCAHRVTFLGGRTDIPSLLPAADLGLLSSHTESGPLVLIEYLATSLPIVSTRVGEIGARLADLGVPGFVAPGDAEAFARELDVVLALSPAERRARGQLGRRLVADGWDIRNVMPRWYAVYRDAIAARAR